MRVNRILVIDDHDLFLKGFKEILSIRFPESTIDLCLNIGEDILKKLEVYDLIISDYEIPNTNIVTLIEDIRRTSQVPILIVTMHKRISVIESCTMAGANGFLLKDEYNLLDVALNEVLLGRKFYSPQLRNALNSSKTKIHQLSEREKQVLRYMAKGLSNKEMSDALLIAIETVKSHKRNIKSKLNLDNRADLFDYYNEFIK